MIFLKTPIMAQPQHRYAILLSNILFWVYCHTPLHQPHHVILRCLRENIVGSAIRVIRVLSGRRFQGRLWSVGYAALTHG